MIKKTYNHTVILFWILHIYKYLELNMQEKNTMYI